MKKLVLFIVALVCCINLKAQEMNAYGVSFCQDSTKFTENLIGTYLEISFAVDVVEDSGTITEVTGIKELTAKSDAKLLFADVVYSFLCTEKYITEEQVINPFHYIYTIGDELGTVDIRAEGRFLKIKFSR